MSEFYNLFKKIFVDGCTGEDELSGYLNNHIKLIRFKKGQLIVSTGGKSEYTYLIYSGEYCELNYSSDGTKTVLAVRSAPQLIGIVSLINRDDSFQNDMVATKNIKAIAVDNAYFYSQLETDAALDLLILKNLCDKIVSASHLVRRNQFFNAKDNFKIFLHEQWKKGGKSAGPFCLNRSNRVIADEMNVSERTIYRILGELKQEGMITVIKGNIYMDKSQISENAAFYKEVFASSPNIPPRATGKP